ncbi:MAG: sulfatase [Prolixibacteraceae bacterium]
MEQFIKTIGLGITVLSSSGIVTTAQEKPNILWIVADDLGPDAGCFGTENVRTPNIDKLAYDGIRFTQLHAVVPVCSPSRSSLITGMYPVSVNCHQHRTRNKTALPGTVLPVTEYFRQAGYYVSNGDGTRPGRPGKTDYNFAFDKPFFDGVDWSGRKQGQPFFAQMQIHFPHRPFKTDPVHPVNRQALTIPPVYPDHPLTREDWAQYLESVQQVDHYVGRIMERLEKDSLLHNTIVFFFGDQGRPMVRAKQFLYDEGTHTPLIIRFPDERKAGSHVDDLLSTVDIPATSLLLAGISLPEHIQGQDIFSGNKREYVFSSRDRMDETVDRIRSVRNRRLKFIRNYYPARPYTQFNTYKVTMYPVLTLMKVLYKRGKLTPGQAAFMSPVRPKEELYDLTNDPFEMENLSADPDYAADLEHMRRALDEWVARNDKGVYPEDREEIDYWAKDAEQAFQKKMDSYQLPADISDEEFLRWWEGRLKAEQQ